MQPGAGGTLVSDFSFDFGQDVITSDGHKIGSLTALVVDAGTFEVTRIMIDPGMFGGPDRMADVSAVATAGGDRISLEIDQAAAKQLQEYAKEQYIQPNRVPDAPIIMPASGVGGPVMYDNPDTGMGFPGGDAFDMAPIDPPRLQILSNLNTNEVMLRKGADVIASDYNKVGTVDAIQAGERGAISGFIVRAGGLFGHDVAIPITAVKEFGTDKVRLTIDRDSAERSRV
jgi:sporulation protein YlmC with PRC-barrel domain